MIKLKIKRIIPYFGLFLFIGAVGILYHELRTYRLHDILTQVHAIRPGRIGLALLFTAFSYLSMTGYDLLALRYIRHPLSTPKTILAAFIGYAFSNNISLSVIAGASVRYRLYTAWGLSAGEITHVVFFCTATLWLGFCALGGVVFIFEPISLPQSLHWPLATVKPLGIVLLTPAVLYLVMTLRNKKEWAYRRWHFALPNWRLSGAQFVIAATDWLLASTVLFSLMPWQVPITFLHFLGIFLIAQLAGIISQVPGGLGVFESVLLLLTPKGLSTPEIMGTLVVYRGIYYLLPLLIAAVVLGVEELLRQRKFFSRIQTLTEGTLEALFVPLFSLVVFAGGAVLMFSNALPAIPRRLAYLEDFLPLPFLELSHLFASLVGMGLMLLARGLQRRLDGAYVLTILLLLAGMAASLLKGVDYEEAIILLILLLLLLPCRRFFYRRTSLLSERFSPGWLVAIAMVLISSVGLGFFAFKHVEYRHELWWQFSALGEAPRFLRATVGAMGLALSIGLLRLLRPATYRPAPPEDAAQEAVEAIVRNSPSAEANLALLGDKRFWFDANRQAFIMYGVEKQSWVSMGDPVGPVEQWPDLLWQFRQAASDYGARAVFYQVGHEHLHLYIDMGLTLLKLGEAARVPLTTFSLDGSHRKKLRYSHRKLAKAGCHFDVLEPNAVMTYIKTLKAVSDAWLEEKNTREKGFSLGFFDPQYLQQFPLAMVRMQDEIIAFADIWQSSAYEELSIDLMRHRPDAPNGVMDYLFIELLLWGKARGFQWFNLGMAPLSGMETGEMAPLWHRIGDLVSHLGDHFYGFQGLRSYKEKFEPVWQPKYLAAPGGLSIPLTLADIGSLISGGFKGILFK
jgi:phosphatidylglycerol lysyltransferase